MPVRNAAADSGNLPLSQFRKLKERYGGPLTKENISHLSREVRSIAYKGRYANRSGGSPVCLVALDFDHVSDGIGKIVAVCTSLQRTGEERKPLEEFLRQYKFLMTDCA